MKFESQPDRGKFQFNGRNTFPKTFRFIRFNRRCAYVDAAYFLSDVSNLYQVL